MTAATKAKLGAGTVMEFENPGSPGTWKALTNAVEVGETGSEGSFVPTNEIDKLTEEYIAGRKEPPNKTLLFNDKPGNADYEEFVGLVMADTEMQMRLTFTTGRRAVFTIVFSGFIVGQPESDGIVRARAVGKQSGDATWSVV